MSYQYNTALTGASTTTITEGDVFGGLSTASLHTIQCSGNACVVEVAINNNSNFVSINTLTNAYETVPAFGVTAIKFTITTGTCEISLAGTTQ